MPEPSTRLGGTLHPGEGYPNGLVDALYYATDFGKSRDAYDALLEVAATAGFPTVRDEGGGAHVGRRPRRGALARPAG